MKILKRDLKHGLIVLKVTDEEDLWYLSHTIDQGDLIRGRTERKIKVGSDENAKTIRKPVHLKIKTEKTEYEPQNNSLRVLGTITEGPDDVPLGSHHSFNLETNDEISIQKEYWPKYQLKKLEEAEKEKNKILLVVFDREQAHFAALKKKGYEKLSSLKGEVQKKQLEENTNKNFYAEISKSIEEYVKRLNATKIIIASPAFWKEYLLKELPDELKKKTMPATISTGSEEGFEELLKRSELNKALEEDRAANELQAIEEVMHAIREEKACYGLKDSKEKIEMGATNKLIVSENLLKEMKEKNKYREIDSLLQTAEQTNTEIIIITSKDNTAKLDGLGGIAGVLRWKA